MSLYVHAYHFDFGHPGPEFLGFHHSGGENAARTVPPFW